MKGTEMNTASMVVLAFGLFSITGGFIGYFKAGSMASLVAGSISGIFLLISAYGLVRGNQLSAVVSLVVAVLLGARFLMTMVKQFKVMPDLLMVLLSAVTIVVVVMHLIKKA
jgi:uncharacterized membrane protein (UPF0136 family)